MTEPSTAYYDFAVLTYVDALDRLPDVISGLAERFAPAAIELFGKPETGEVAVLFRFPFAQYSAALRSKMEREAGALKARLVEPSLLAAPDRTKFYAERLGGEAQASVGARPREAIDALRAKLGLHKATPTLAVRFESVDGLVDALATAAAEGSFLLPSQRPLAAGAKVALALQAPGVEPMIADASVVARDGAGLRLAVEITPEIEAFIGRQAAKQKEGRRRPEGGARQHPRYDSCLEVRFDSGARLREEYARNIGKGGLFVRSENPPPLRAQVRLRLALPDGSAAETNAEVVHVVTAAEAKARRTLPGAGLAFGTGDTLFQRAIAQCVEGAGRRLRALVADDDERLRQVLGEALEKGNFEVQYASDGAEATSKLGACLFTIDLLVLDLGLPQLDGAGLIERVRRLGPELDLKIAVLSGEEDAAAAAALVRPGGADVDIRRGTPTSEIVARIVALLER